jgi:hypothetical protein
MASQAAIPIELRQLREFAERANRLLQQVKWTPKAAPPASAQAQPGAPEWRDSSITPAVEQRVSLLQVAHQLSRDPVLLSDDAHRVMSVIRRGVQIGAHLSKLYGKASNLETLIEQNQRGGLADPQKAEFRAKYQTAAAIALFTLAYTIAWELASYKAEETASVPVELGPLPEVTLRSPVEAIDCALYYYGAFLERSGAVNDDLQLLKATSLYFRAVLDEIKLREGSLEFVEPFTTRTYKLEGSELTIAGFATDLGGAAVGIEFNRVELHQIVGNRDAKHWARRLAERLVCYDPVAKRNPMYDLGGLSLVNLGHGEPGTGKSMIIAAVATLLDDYCRRLGIPFLFWPMPDTIVSTFQGGSAERMMQWMSSTRDPTRIIYAPIDDAENNLEERTRQGVSAGVREVIAVFLRNTEGAYAVHRGNCAIELYTNLPDQIDKAVMSRIIQRTYIGGAKGWHDFLDQDHLWWKRYRELDSRFVTLADPTDYAYLTEQRQVRSLAEVADSTGVPGEASIRAIVERVQERQQPDTHAFFAHLFAAVKAEYPFFTSRDVRNIQRAVDGRIMDFDFPSEWVDRPELFFRTTYERKVEMLRDLMRTNMGGLSFGEIRLQESIRYLDNMVRIADTGRRRRIDEAAEQLSIQAEARTKVLGKA